MKYNRVLAAQKIRQWQKETGLKGIDIAKKLKVSPPYYSDIRKGKQRGSIEILAQLCDIFGHSLDELFTPNKKVELPFKKMEMRKTLRPIVGQKNVDDTLECLELWFKSPKAMRNALKAYMQTQ